LRKPLAVVVLVVEKVGVIGEVTNPVPIPIALVGRG
jgi:hypothetical protein